MGAEHLFTQRANLSIELAFVSSAGGKRCGLKTQDFSRVLEELSSGAKRLGVPVPVKQHAPGAST